MARSLAESYLNHKITKAVISVPDLFTEAQRNVTRDAGIMAGLDLLNTARHLGLDDDDIPSVVNETTAAAYGYCLGHPDFKNIFWEGRRSLVYHLGGTTSVASVINLYQENVIVLASASNSQLGGNEFNQNLIDHSVGIYKSSYDVDITKKPAMMGRMESAVESAKQAL